MAFALLGIFIRVDAQHAGLVLTAQPVIMAVVAPFGGWLSDRRGRRWPAIIGMLILAVGLSAVAMLVARGSLWAIAGGLAVVRLRIGTFVSPNNSALMGAAPRNRQGIASGVLATARNVGMVPGVGGRRGSVYHGRIARHTGIFGVGRRSAFESSRCRRVWPSRERVSLLCAE